MQTVTVKQGQSILDLAVAYTGDVLSAFDIALLNGLSVSDQPSAGTVLMIPEPSDKNIVNLFNEKNQPATALTWLSATAAQIGSVIFEEPAGISYWAIYDNFIIQP